MKKKFPKSLLPMISAVALLSSCTQEFACEFEKFDDYLVVKKDSLTLNIEIVDDAIVHVTKSIDGVERVKLPEYVRVLENQGVEWSVKESRGRLVIETDDMRVYVDNDGSLEYERACGKHLLSESPEMTYIDPKREGNVVSQAFVAGDEALYGLGQFQGGIMNWRGVPAHLTQYNQEAVVPFLVSTKGYGIYWSNYAVTDVNEAVNEISFADVLSAAAAAVVEHRDSNVEKEDVAKSKSQIDRESNIRTTTFTPSQSGLYSFLIDSETEGGRRDANINLIIDADTVIHYSTIWAPECYSGVKELEAGKEYKLTFQNAGAKNPGRLFYNEPDFNKTVFSSDRGEAIDYYVVCGDTPAEVIALNHKLTGQTPMLEKKHYGFWHCRERFHSQEELLNIANEMREREVPVDVIIQDWNYWPMGTKGPEWDRSRYPDPKAMSDEVHDLNMKLMVSVWPSVKNDPLLRKYKLDKLKFSKGHDLDFYDERVSDRYYRMLSDSMFHKGINSIWLDGSEGTLGVKTAVGESNRVANTYSLVLTKAMYEGKRKEFPRERVMNLTRSAYSGQQRYGAVTWSGDVAATWEQFEEQIAAGLNFTMAGIPYWSHDIGGFFRDSRSMNPIFKDQYKSKEFIELLTRWFQFGTFSPIFRLHGYVSNTEIWNYGEEFEKTAREFIALRYRLLPYIYSEAWRVTTEGHSMMSPLAYYYPEDKRCWGVKDQFFFGESIMAAFVTEYGAREKSVYLPEGGWYNFWSGEKISGGGYVDVAAPLDQTPLFVREGSILVESMDKLQYATQKSDKPLCVKIYPGSDARFTLYLDDNESYDYEGGEYSEVEMSYDESDKTLTMECGDGEYIDFEKDPMKFTVVVNGSKSATDVTFAGEKIEFKM